MSEDWFSPEEPTLIASVIDAYYEIFMTGGSLHIVLDDGNWRRSDLEFCAAVAREIGDLIGEAIANAFLRLPDDVLGAAKKGMRVHEKLKAVMAAWRAHVSKQQAERLLADRRERGITHLVSVWTTVIGRTDAPDKVCEHASEAEAIQDFEYRVAAANEEVNVRRAYRIEMAALGEPPTLTHDKLAATHWKDQPGLGA